MTKITAPAMPRAVLIFLDTPRNGQIPRILDKTMLFTRTAPTVINSHSLDGMMFSLFILNVMLRLIL